jgi:hypothetical protein
MKNIVFLVWLGLIVVLTFTVHELAHGLAGAALGFDMRVGINGASPIDAARIDPLQRDVVTAAGPVITLAQGLCAAMIAWASGWIGAFQVSAAALSMRILAAGASLRTPNDEARLGLSWDLGFWTLHILVIGALALMVLWAARSARVPWRQGVMTFTAIFVAMILIVVFERQFPSVVLSAVR